MRVRPGGFCETQRIYADLVASLVPDWCEVQIVPHATYLGFEIGPSLTRCDRWQAAVSKFSSRAAVYAQAGVAPSLSWAHYETHILPTLSYVAQMVEVDASLRHAFVVAVERMLHVPHRVVPEAALQQLRALGLPGATDPMVYTAAALGRAAMSMKTVVLDEAVSLAKVRAQHAP